MRAHVNPSASLSSRGLHHSGEVMQPFLSTSSSSSHGLYGGEVFRDHPNSQEQRLENNGGGIGNCQFLILTYLAIYTGPLTIAAEAIDLEANEDGMMVLYY